jgi:hypothetical protein
MFFALAISVVVVATSIAPSDAVAKPRPQNTEPLAGDPTDTNDGPVPRNSSAAKSAFFGKAGTSIGTDAATSGPTLRARRELWIRFFVFSLFRGSVR